MKKLAVVLAALSFASMPVSADAKPCRDSKGHFIKCPPAAHVAAPKKAPCRDSKGHFFKCK